MNQELISCPDDVWDVIKNRIPVGVSVEMVLKDVIRHLYISRLKYAKAFEFDAIPGPTFSALTVADASIMFLTMFDNEE